ncbi:hypothetical protein Ancab_012418 [Ancistrocladus abbreviatus]
MGTWIASHSIIDGIYFLKSTEVDIEEAMVITKEGEAKKDVDSETLVDKNAITGSKIVDKEGLKWVEKVKIEKVAKSTDANIVEEPKKWMNATIGYVIGAKINYTAMEAFVNARWNTIGTPQFILHEKGYFVFRFKSQ